jgi:hypothetical protein
MRKTQDSRKDAKSAKENPQRRTGHFLFCASMHAIRPQKASCGKLVNCLHCFLCAFFFALFAPLRESSVFRLPPVMPMQSAGCDESGNCTP